MKMSMTTKQAAEKWNISDRRVRILCAEGKYLALTKKAVGGKYPMMLSSRQMAVISLLIVCWI